MRADIIWTNPDFNGWIWGTHVKYQVRIYPLNGFYEWEVCEGEHTVADAGTGESYQECKDIAQGFIDYQVQNAS
jgi:hypothetical protein